MTTHAPPTRHEAGSQGSPEEDGTGPFAHATEPNATARLGVWLCYLASATVPWTAVTSVGSVRLGDTFLLLAMACLVIADIDHKMPSFPEWVWFFVATIVAIGLLNEFFPTPNTYFLTRQTVVGTQIVLGQDVASGNLGVLIRFLVPILGLPLIFIRAFYFDRRAIGRNAIAFTVGVAISGMVAFTDGRGWTTIAYHITGLGGVGDRSTGLTENPNYVAMGCVFALPFVMWQLVHPITRNRVWAAVGLVTVLLGLYASGSRSGGGAGLVALLLPIVLLPRYRKLLPVTSLIVATIASVAFVVVPGLGRSVLKALRLTGNQGAGSDLARSVVNDQAERDFHRSPLFGVGLRVAGESHIVYLQALAAGGVLLLTGLLVFLGGALVRSIRTVRYDEFGAALFTSILAGAIFNAAQNALTLRIVYLPSALAAALPLLHRRRENGG